MSQAIFSRYHRTSKRYRKAKRRRYILLRRRVIARIGQLRKKGSTMSDRQMERHNGLVRWVNRLVPTIWDTVDLSRSGLEIIDSVAECPRCGNQILLMGSPDCWEERALPSWRRLRRNKRPVYRVTGYWGGIGDCCEGFLATQPDGECHFYEYESAPV